MGVTFDTYCKERGVQWAMREDPWVQNIFSCAVPQADVQINKIRDIQHAEDFTAMNNERLQTYESMLKIPFLTLNRRDVVQGFWAGWGAPSPTSIKTICATICNLDLTNITVTFGTQQVPTFPIVNVNVSVGQILSGAYRFLCYRAIRQHIPAHYQLQVDGDFDYLDIDETEDKKLSEMCGKDGSVELWNFIN